MNVREIRVGVEVLRKSDLRSISFRAHSNNGELALWNEQHRSADVGSDLGVAGLGRVIVLLSSGEASREGRSDYRIAIR